MVGAIDIGFGDALEPGTDEAIFLNEQNEVADASRSNAFVKIGDWLLTPPLSAGALDGCS